MAMSVNPAIEGNQPLSSGHCDPAAMIGPRSTVPIRARGHVVPHQQAVHMTATGRTCTRGKTLANRGPSTHDNSSLRRGGAAESALPTPLSEAVADEVGSSTLDSGRIRQHIRDAVFVLLS